MNQYVQGNEIQLSGTFTDLAGVLVNPTTVAGYVRRPDGEVDNLTPQLITTGLYRAVYTPTMPGVHFYRFTGAGTVVAAEEKNFAVQSYFGDTPP